MTQTVLPDQMPVTALAEGFSLADHAQWVALVEKSLKGGDFEKRLVSRTADGVRIDPLYTRASSRPQAVTELPGTAPFTRGTTPGRTDLGWAICQFVVEADPKTANAVILEDLEGGATALALKLDADGREGLPVAKSALATALDSVLLEICPVTLVAGEYYAEAASAMNAVWDDRGLAPAQRLGHLSADPLGWLAMTGDLAKPLDRAMADAAQLAVAAQSCPHVTALVADGHPYHAAGASEAQELAAVLATLVAYLRACEAEGLAPANALPKIAIALASDADQFSTIAKLRAARRLVWRVADACGAGDAVARMHLASASAWRMMAKRDPWTNMLRTTMACAAAALGGAHQITVLPYTFALGKPDRMARRMARNTQLVLMEESSLGRVVDPAGGSWYVEKLTDDMAAKAWALFQEIEAEGGMAAALASGHVQGRIATVAEARAKAIASGRMELTGVSAFPKLGDDGITAEPWPRPSPDAATATPAVTVPPLRMTRLAEPFEALRDAADAHTQRTGTPPTIFLASLGEIADHTLRSTWIKNYLAAGGIAVLASDGYATPEAAVAAFKASGARATCICSSDTLYVAHAEATAKALKAAGATLVLMAGRPGEREAALRAAGIDQFLFAGLDAVATLGGLQEKIVGSA